MQINMGTIQSVHLFIIWIKSISMLRLFMGVYALLVMMLITACSRSIPNEAPYHIQEVTRTVVNTIGVTPPDSPVFSTEDEGDFPTPEALATTSLPKVISPTSTLPGIIPTPSPTPSPTQVVALTPIQFHQPGESSEVSPPLLVDLCLSSIDSIQLIIELHGSDGRLLFRQLLFAPIYASPCVPLVMSIDFQIRSSEEPGRLVVLGLDQFGRLVDVNSVNLILLSEGNSNLKSATISDQAIAINKPGSSTKITGTSVRVFGDTDLDPQSPLRVMLIDESGRVVGQRLAGIQASTTGGRNTFLADVPYRVSDVTPVRVIVYQDGQPLSAYTHLSSTMVTLSP